MIDIILEKLITKITIYIIDHCQLQWNSVSTNYNASTFFPLIRKNLQLTSKNIQNEKDKIKLNFQFLV